MRRRFEMTVVILLTLFVVSCGDTNNNYYQQPEEKTYSSVDSDVNNSTDSEIFDLEVSDSDVKIINDSHSEIVDAFEKSDLQTIDNEIADRVDNELSDHSVDSNLEHDSEVADNEIADRVDNELSDYPVDSNLEHDSGVADNESTDDFNLDSEIDSEIEDGDFEPKCSVVARGELVIALYDAMNIDDDRCREGHYLVNADFPDVPAGTELSCKLAILMEKKRFSYGHDDFRPFDLLNRAQFAKILINAIYGLVSYKAPITQTFDDVLPFAWYFDYVEMAVELGLIGEVNENGDIDRNFHPSDVLDKCFMEDVLKRAFSGVVLKVGVKNSPGDSANVKLYLGTQGYGADGTYEHMETVSVNNGEFHVFRVNPASAYTLICQERSIYGYVPVVGRRTIYNLKKGDISEFECEYTYVGHLEAVENVEVDSVDSNQVKLEWDPVDGADFYRVYYGKTSIETIGVGEYDTYVDTIFPQNTYTISALEAETEYFFSVTAFKKYGDYGIESELYSHEAQAKTLPLKGYNFIIKTEDSVGKNILYESFLLNGIGSVPTPEAFHYANLEERMVIYFESGLGYIKTPDALLIESGNIVVPDNIRIEEWLTDEDSSSRKVKVYTFGETLALKRGYTYEVFGIYTPRIGIVREIGFINHLEGKNKEVQHIITVFRHSDDLQGDDPVNVIVKDTLTGIGYITGDKGGKMKVVPGSVSCSTDCGDITQDVVQLAFDTPGQAVEIKYTLKSNNSDISAGETSRFYSTVDIAYKIDGKEVVMESGLGIWVNSPK